MVPELQEVDDLEGDKTAPKRYEVGPRGKVVHFFSEIGGVEAPTENLLKLQGTRSFVSRAKNKMVDKV